METGHRSVHAIIFFLPNLGNLETWAPYFRTNFFSQSMKQNVAAYLQPSSGEAQHALTRPSVKKSKNRSSSNFNEIFSFGAISHWPKVTLACKKTCTTDSQSTHFTWKRRKKTIFNEGGAPRLAIKTEIKNKKKKTHCFSSHLSHNFHKELT